MSYTASKDEEIVDYSRQTSGGIEIGGFHAACRQRFSRHLTRGISMTTILSHSAKEATIAIPRIRNAPCTPEPVGFMWGLWKLLDTSITRKRKERFVSVQCTGCGVVNSKHYANLIQGKTTQCQSCANNARKNLAPRWLVGRMGAAKQRCVNPNFHQYKDYGGRGIKFAWENPSDGALWVMENLGLHPELEIDRINNNGNYEPGNLRWVSHKTNMSNQRNSKILRKHEIRTKYPYVLYSDNTLQELIFNGLSDAQIAERWKSSDRPKGYGLRTSACLDVIEALKESRQAV